MRRSSRIPVHALVALTVLWFSISILFVIALSREQSRVDCHMQDSSFGKRHWQWNPPGTYCTVSSNTAIEWPAGAAPPGWSRPPPSRAALVEVLIASGAAIGILWIVWWFKVRTPD